MGFHVIAPYPKCWRLDTSGHDGDDACMGAMARERQCWADDDNAVAGYGAGSGQAGVMVA